MKYIQYTHVSYRCVELVHTHTNCIDRQSGSLTAFHRSLAQNHLPNHTHTPILIFSIHFIVCHYYLSSSFSYSNIFMDYQNKNVVGKLVSQQKFEFELNGFEICTESLELWSIKHNGIIDFGWHVFFPPSFSYDILRKLNNEWHKVLSKLKAIRWSNEKSAPFHLAPPSTRAHASSGQLTVSFARKFVSIHFSILIFFSSANSWKHFKWKYGI